MKIRGTPFKVETARAAVLLSASNIRRLIHPEQALMVLLLLVLFAEPLLLHKLLVHGDVLELSFFSGSEVLRVLRLFKRMPIVHNPVRWLDIPVYGNATG